MTSTPAISQWDCDASVLDVMTRWPADRALMMLHSGRVDSRWARWSILASPIVRYQFGQDGRSRWIGSPPDQLRDVVFTDDPLTDVDAILAATRHDDQHSSRSTLPYCGGWIGHFSYDLGRVIEPRAQAKGGAALDRCWPQIDLARCPNAMAFDHLKEQWSIVGDSTLANDTDLASRDDDGGYELGPLRPSTDRTEYTEMVRRTIAAIGAGDIYQANIAQRFTAAFHGSARGLGRIAFQLARPWYGAYLEFPDDRCLVSLSPELFLNVDPMTRLVTTRPIKGTRPSTDSIQTLHGSVKDTAELHMIVDLMRNDLGRVCEFGSVRVVEARVIESHPTVHHGVGEVAGILREGASVGDVLRATFPGGSITGAPKIRAMQIIDELEPARRGPYCGAIGMISDCGTVNLNVAIRTLLMDGPRADYWAGAGIVADSDPGTEYRETLDKTAVLQSLCGLPVAAAPG